MTYTYRRITLSVMAAIAAIMMSSLALAAPYTVAGSWTDPTMTGPEWAASYGAECRVNGGASTPIDGLTTPGFSIQMTANQGDTIECRARAINVVVPASPVNGNWTAWVAAAAPISPRTPADQTNFSITITPAQ